METTPISYWKVPLNKAQKAVFVANYTLIDNSSFLSPLIFADMNLKLSSKNELNPFVKVLATWQYVLDCHTHS